MSYDGEPPLRDENALLREEVRVARDAANITAQAVVAQFAETERVLARLSEVVAQRRAVLDAASQVSIVATDAEGVIVLFNSGAEHLLGWRAAEVVGTATPAAFHVPEELDAAAASLSAELGRRVRGLEVFFVLADQRRENLREWMLVRKDGSRVPVDLSVTLVRAPSGEASGILCVALDLTARKRAEAEVRAAMEATEAANRTKSAFLANMSHELRTPLNAIIGYSEMLMEEMEEKGEEEALSDLDKIRSAGQHLLGLINQVLDISKIETGRIELFIEEIDVHALVDEVARTAQPLVAKNRNTFAVECEGVGSMRTDALRLKQILFNLIGNAAKFTEAGTVTLTVCVEHGSGGERLAFRVSDTGIGMTPEQLGRIFTPFVQADASTTRRFGGTGLGLAISKQFCELMGGAITVESEVGRGTSFTARLPRAPEASHGTEAAAVPVRVEADAAAVFVDSGTILVIDDDPVARDLVTRFLEREGYRVLTAGDGANGIERARLEKPDVITLDVLMPGRDGWSVLAELKSDPVTADIPVVMVTILDQRNAGYALGAADYLMKPIDRSRLVAVIERYRRQDGASSVLVVEDDEGVRTLMKRMLEKEGCRVRLATNGQEGLDRVAEEIPGVIMLDLLMPVMDGFTFLEVLRARPEWRGIPVIVVTALELLEPERHDLGAHVQRIVQKGSYAYQELLAEVRSLVKVAIRR